MSNIWFCYIAKCKDESLYTGITTDIKRREYEHNNNERGSKYLKSKRPVSIVYFEKYNSHADAAKRESAIKNWTRENKLKLIKRA